MRHLLTLFLIGTANIALHAQSIFDLTQPRALATSSTLVINEADVDTPGFDDREFIELYGEPGGSLDGIVLVLYRGNNNTVYAQYDLSGQVLNEEGFFVVGNALVPNVGLVIPDNTLRNGPDAMALYTGALSEFPNGTPVILENLIDALVYDTNDPLAPGLLPLLLPGQPQVNEGANNNAALESMSRVPDGGEQRVTETYVMQAPTPGTFNVVACDGGTLTFAGDEPQSVIACTDLPDEPIEVLVNGQVPSDNYALIVCNQVNQIISVVFDNSLDFFGAPAGIVRIWGVSYTGTLNPATLQPGLPITGIQGDECAVLSSGFIIADRQTCIPPECLGGQITVNSLTAPQIICWNGSNPILSLQTNSAFAPNYLWVMTNFSGSIVLTTEENFIDLSAYGSGTLLVRGIAYTGELNLATLQPGLPIAGIATDACLSLSTNQVMVTSNYCAYTGGCSDLFISEYIEGSSNNKALELYNPTPFPIDMGPYVMQTYNNSATVPTNSLNLQGVIQPGAVYVIANTMASSAILQVANITSNVTFFNGNDPIVLRKNGEIIDIMGIIGPEADPLEPNGFEVDNGNGSMSEYTLVRKSEVTEGSTDWAVGQNQWDVYPQDTFTFLGSHSIGLCDFPDEPTITFTNSAITIVQGMTAQIGVAVNWPIEEAIAEVVLAGGTAMAGVHFDDIFTATVTMPVQVFTAQMLSMSTFNFPAIDEPVTVILHLQPVTPAEVAIEVLTITILPFQEPPVAPFFNIIDVHGEDEDSFEALSEGVFCELRGVVHGINLNPTGLFFTLIDPTAGIAVYHPDQNFGYTVQEGDSIRVIGEIDQFRGLTRIVPVFIQFVSSNNTLTEPGLTVVLGEVHESMPVEFKCAQLADPAQWLNTPPWFDVDLQAGLNLFTMRIYATTDIFGTEPPQGVFSVWGIGSQEDEFAPYNEGYFFIPQLLSYFTEPVEAAFAVNGDVTAGEPFTIDNLSTGGSVYTWLLGDGTTSSDEHPQHTYTLPGLYTIQLTAFDVDGVCSDQVTMTIEVLPLSVQERAAAVVQVYPNPAGAQATIEADRELGVVRIFDASGRMLSEQHSVANHRVVIDVSSYARGLYVIEAAGARHRLVVQ